MLSKFIEPYVKTKSYFSAEREEKGIWQHVAFSVCLLVAIPFVRYGVGNLLGLLPEDFVSAYALVSAFYMWKTPLLIAQQQVVLIPYYAVGLFFYAGFLHSLLWLAQGANASFYATLRCVCYAVPYLLLTILPYSGALVAVLYASLFLAYSLKATHGTRWSRVLPVVALNCSVLFVVCRLFFP